MCYCLLEGHTEELWTCFKS